jgi:hypothetical protein
MKNMVVKREVRWTIAKNLLTKSKKPLNLLYYSISIGKVNACYTK